MTEEITEPIVLDSSYNAKTDELIAVSKDIAAAILSSSSSYVSSPTKDSSTGIYDLDSIKAWLAQGRTGKVYTVAEPKGKTIACTKLDDNAGIPNPTPWTLASQGSDQYMSEGGPFRHFDVDASLSDANVEQIYAFTWDAAFSRTEPANGEVMEAIPPVYYREWEDENYVYKSVTDTEREGYWLPEMFIRPDGSVRTVALVAKYPLCGGGWYSRSGMEYRRFVSHNTTVGVSSGKGAGWACLSGADLWYIQTMFLMKYATKHSQSVFAGCTVYTTQCQPTVAEEGVKRVIVSTANANALVVGSAMMLGAAGGTATSAPDRGNATSYDKFSSGKITKIEAYDDSNSAVYFEEQDSTFDTATTDWLSTTEWRTGACDGLGGDGSPTDCTSGKEPFLLQGIELGHGAYEVVEDMVFNYQSDGLHVLVDPSPASGSVSSSAVDAGVTSAQPSSNNWVYPLYTVTSEGVPVSKGTGGSQSTGNCDGQYELSTATTSGYYEFLAFGYLRNGGYAGLRCAPAHCGLGLGGWNFGSRLSGQRRRG